MTYELPSEPKQLDENADTYAILRENPDAIVLLGDSEEEAEFALVSRKRLFQLLELEEDLEIAAIVRERTATETVEAVDLKDFATSLGVDLDEIDEDDEEDAFGEGYVEFDYFAKNEGITQATKYSSEDSAEKEGGSKEPRFQLTKQVHGHGDCTVWRYCSGEGYLVPDYPANGELVVLCEAELYDRSHNWGEKAKRFYAEV